MARRKTDKDAEGYPPWTSPIRPAPGDLRILHAFLLTQDVLKGTEELATPRALADWSVTWRLAPTATELTAADFERAVAVREALSALVRARGKTVDASVFETLNAAAAASPIFPRFAASGVARYEPFVEGLEGVFGRLLHIAAKAFREGRWVRFKICANPECRQVFYDFSRNHSGTWCVKALCGNRMNARAFRRRHPRYSGFRSGSHRTKRRR